MDAGVFTGMSVGITSLIYHYANALRGLSPTCDHVASHVSDGSTLARTSWCPVTFLSNCVYGVVQRCVRTFSPKHIVSQDSHREERGVSQVCPLSGKSGATCPIASFVSQSSS